MVTSAGHRDDGDMDQGAFPPTPPVATAEPRRLTRSTDDRMIAGVCGGVARYLGVDATLVRIGAVVLALTGIGVAAYGVAWLLVPDDDEDPATRRTPWRIFGVVAVLVVFGSWLDGWAGDSTTLARWWASRAWASAACSSRDRRASPAARRRWPSR